MIILLFLLPSRCCCCCCVVSAQFASRLPFALNLRLKFRTHFRTLSLLHFHFRCRVFSLGYREDFSSFSIIWISPPLANWISPAYLRLTPFAVCRFSAFFCAFPLLSFALFYLRFATTRARAVKNDAGSSIRGRGRDRVRRALSVCVWSPLKFIEN